MTEAEFEKQYARAFRLLEDGNEFKAKFSTTPDRTEAYIADRPLPSESGLPYRVQHLCYDRNKFDYAFVHEKHFATVEDVKALFCNWLVRGVQPDKDDGGGWKNLSGTLNDFSELKNVAPNSRKFLKEALETMAAPGEVGLRGLEQLFEMGLDPHALVHYGALDEDDENDEDKSYLLTRYLNDEDPYGDGDLPAEALDIIDCFIRHGFRPDRIPEQECLLFQEMAGHAASPEFLPVWTRLCEAGAELREFKGLPAYEAEAYGACFSVKAALMEHLDMRDYLNFNVEAKQIGAAWRIAERVARGVAPGSVRTVNSALGKKISRVLVSAPLEPVTDSSGEAALAYKPDVVLNCEGMALTVSEPQIAAVDTELLKAGEGDLTDASELFPKVIGKRVAGFEYGLHKQYASSERRIVGIGFFGVVLEDGTVLKFEEIGDNAFRMGTTQKSWGEFVVTAAGKIESRKPYPKTTRRYHSTFYAEELYLKHLPEMRKSVWGLDEHMTQAWKRWFAENRGGKKRKSWVNAAADEKDPEAKAFLFSEIKAWMDAEPTRNPAERKTLRPGFRTDAELAVQELMHMPEFFTSALGIVWPDPEYHDSDKNLEKGLRLTKTVEEANAIAREHGWQISFKHAA